jgi:phage host-nuclease inhibitor protein Gam
MAARRKRQSIDVPATRAEADALVRDYARLEHDAGHYRGTFDEIVKAMKEERDDALKVVEAEQSAIFTRLQAWWEATGKDEAGHRRSLVIDGTKIGSEMSKPKLTLLNKMKEADVLGWLRRKGVSQFIRTKSEIDKPAILKALGERDCCGSFADLLDEAFAVTQKDEFYIAVAPLEKTLTQGDPK